MNTQLPLNHEVFDALPFDKAMKDLVVIQGAKVAAAKVESAKLPPLATAALFIYVDDLGRAHEIVQADDSALSAFLHAIIHRREGDFSNSHYWYRKALTHPILHVPAMDGPEFVERVHTVIAEAKDSDELIEWQRQEWLSAFNQALAAEDLDA